MTKHPKLIDMTNQIFGEWTVVKQTGNTKRGAAVWQCVCVCGTIKNVIGSDIRQEKSTNCGCVNKKRIAQINKTHDKSSTRIYNIWQGMRGRCNNTNNPSYDRYGGRGIKVCNKWNVFSNFFDWATQNGYKSSLSIDRIDNNGNYTPSNCRWVDRKIQASNRPRYVDISPDGKLWWHKAEENGITYDAYNWRKRKGWPMEVVVSWPMNKKRSLNKRDPKTGKYLAEKKC